MPITSLAAPQTALDPAQVSLMHEAKLRPPHEAAALLAEHPAATVASVLIELNPGFAQNVLSEFPAGFRHEVLRVTRPDAARQWARNQTYPHGTIGRLMEPAYAVFLPVLAGQSGNTGCQALAVTLRGLTLGELKPGKERVLVVKEGWLGLMNGALVGLVAAVGMYALATYQDSPNALPLAVVVCLAMIGSCVASGVSGALVPLTLKRLGADPATASSIFLTTATDVVSMGLLLGLAALLIR